MKFELPEEPNNIKVKDNKGIIWGKSTNFWHSENGGIRTWKELMVNSSPLEEYKEPKNGDTRNNPDKPDSPAYFDIYIDGIWYHYKRTAGQRVERISFPNLEW